MIKEIKAKSILRKHKKIDSWFLSSYSINLYRGCFHNCIYCDGRDDKYRVEGDFGRDITIKENALELLEKELNPARKRRPFANGFMTICGGVSDAYQPLEKKYRFTQRILELLYKYEHPVHILTKSSLVEKDIELLRKINNRKKAVVSFSFSTVDDKLGKLLEPGASLPSKRLEAIKKIKESGIVTGMYLMPVVPYITDSYEQLENSVVKATDAGVDFIVFGGMTLKEGKQEDYFLKFLQNNFPEILPKYQYIYSNNNQWGSPDKQYLEKTSKLFCEIADKYKIPKMMPAKMYQQLVNKTELVSLILEQLDYLAKLKGKNTPYGYAAYQILKLEKPVEEYEYKDLILINGIGTVTAGIILEIIKTGKSGFYEKLL